MCGIFGLFDPGGRFPDKAMKWCATASERLSHRGPDGAGQVERLGGRCLLGHTRLSIIDLATGAQPLCNEDGSVWVTFNGEIYNYLELRTQLVAAGHRFRTQSDTEVLVHLYEEWGERLVDHLNGMYAFAILDERRERLFMARDRFGEKPLYYAASPNGQAVAFASELKALLPLDFVDASLDVAAIAQFLVGGVIPAPRTHIAGIRKLKAGEALSFDRSTGMRTWMHWSPIGAVGGAKLRAEQSLEALAAEARTLITDSVRLRLRSDVPVGAFLSGGIDSTLVAASMRELLPAGKISTYCASFDDPELDEAPYARLIARHIESEHHEVRFSSSEAVLVLEELIDHFDEPFGDVSMLPTWAVCREARRTNKVMLSGDGGDELFAGYASHYGYHRWQALRRRPLCNMLARVLSSHWGTHWRGRGLLGFLRSSDRDLLMGGLNLRNASEAFSLDVRSLAWLGLREYEEGIVRHLRLPFPESLVERHVMDYLPEQVLVKVDRASMKVGLENRAPFLDSRLFEFARSFPVERNFMRGQGKAVLRLALPDWVPEAIRWRAKRGFRPPLTAWLRNELKPKLEASLNSPGRLAGIVDLDRPRRLFKEHLEGADHSDVLFRWLVLVRRCA